MKLKLSNNNIIPKDMGFTFPAEWEYHDGVWLSWIHNSTSFLGRIDKVLSEYCEFIKELVKSEFVRINITNELMKNFAQKLLLQHKVNLEKIKFYYHPTNDTWCRDYGPAFLVNSDRSKKIIIDWNYNSWGNKYYPFDLDNSIPKLIAKELNIPIISTNIVMEGGSVEFNGKGTILTSQSCLLNSNRNPNLNQFQIEEALCNYYGQNQVLWISNGVIIGDDTNGHIDNVVRFINHNTVIAGIEENYYDENYSILQRNIKELKQLRLLNGDYLNIIEIPMPKSVIFKNQRLPASYINFYIANHAIIVPIFQNKNDDKALQIIQSCFSDRKVVGLNALEIICGLGNFHCLSQQEPKIL